MERTQKIQQTKRKTEGEKKSIKKKKSDERFNPNRKSRKIKFTAASITG